MQGCSAVVGERGQAESAGRDVIDGSDGIAAARIGHQVEADEIRRSGTVAGGRQVAPLVVTDDRVEDLQRPPLRSMPALELDVAVLPMIVEWTTLPEPGVEIAPP